MLTLERDPEAFKDAVNEAESMIQTSYQLEAGKMMARQRQSNEEVSFFDIEGGLKGSFPTFTNNLSRS